MHIICCIIISPTVVSIILAWDNWGSFELNSQMASSLSQPFVSTPSFALEAREECTVVVNPRSKNCSMSNFAEDCTLLSVFSCFWTSVIGDIGIE